MNIIATKGKNKLIRFTRDNENLFWVLTILIKKYVEINNGIRSLPYSLYLANLINKKEENKIIIKKLKFNFFDLNILFEANMRNEI